MWQTFWSDEQGAIVTVEVIYVITIMIVGMVVGLTTLRDALVSEMADVAESIGSLNQSYSYAGLTGHSASVAGSSFTDQIDFADGAFFRSQTVRSGCVRICTPPQPES